MKSVKKFFLFILKFISILVSAVCMYHLLFWFLWQSDICPNAYDNAYQRALLWQYHALLEEGREPEIIVFGSSYVPFGVDTAVLEEITGQEAQILGVEASLGIPVLVDILYESAKPGDTIVYMLGKSNWYQEDFLVISCALEADKELLEQYWASRGDRLDSYKNILMWRKLYAMFAGGLVEDIRNAVSVKEQVYSIDSFDENGNMTALREGTLIPTDVSATDLLTFDEVELETMDLLNDFAIWCEENDITFVIAYSMYIDGSLAESEEDIAEYHRKMSEYMQADILLTPEQYFLPVDNFYNHPCHLNSIGAENYSEILGNALLEYRNQQPGQ